MGKFNTKIVNDDRDISQHDNQNITKDMANVS
jgi:hypothetical protein